MIDLSSIKVGDQFKNYKDMCNKLGLEVKVGKSKIIQLGQLGRLINLEKNGNSLTVKEIYGNNIPSNLKAPLIDLMILSLLYYMKDRYVNGENVIYLTPMFLMRIMNMVNNDYGAYKYDQAKLSEELDIERTYVEDFYTTSYNTFDRAVKRAMEIFDTRNEQGTVSYGRIIAYNHNGDTKYRMATTEDTLAYDKYKDKVLKDMELNSELTAIVLGKFKEYKDSVHAYMRKEYDPNIISYHKGWKIVINKSIEEVDDSNLSHLIAVTSSLITQKQIENAINRNKKSVNRHHFTHRKYDSVRSTRDYVEKQIQIINKVIPIDVGNK